MEAASLISSSCASHGQDPYAHGKNHHCCHDAHKPLYMVKSKWYSSTCSFRCQQCTGYGQDMYRYCGSGCGGCHMGGDEVVPCCPGLSSRLVNGKYKCY